MSSSRTINVCRQLTSAGGTNAAVELGGSTTAEFRVGRRILVMQVQDVFATTNDPTPVAVAGSAGLWEIRRIAVVATAGTQRTLTLDAALSNNYATTGNRHAQACSIPEYSSAQIQGGNVLSGAAWDGNQGGVVAMYVDGTLDISGSGEISADTAGFRGGAITTNAVNQDTVADDTTGGDGGGKGESLDGRAYALQGRGNYGNGGGGGNSINAGGGGGGNGGAGGLGGMQSDQFNDTAGTAGRAGSQVTFDPAARLSFGGGGGAGQENNSGAGAGGQGGGLILLFVRSLSGSGTIHANGESATAAMTGANDGAGGGGAGGTILVATSSLGAGFAVQIKAIGGDGGSVNRSGTITNFGPGGGAAGGRIVVPSIVPSGQLDVSAGTNGKNQGTNVTRSAQPGSPGVITVKN